MNCVWNDKNDGLTWLNHHNEQTDSEAIKHWLIIFFGREMKVMATKRLIKSIPLVALQIVFFWPQNEDIHYSLNQDYFWCRGKE